MFQLPITRRDRPRGDASTLGRRDRTESVMGLLSQPSKVSMRERVVEIDSDQIGDRDSFHAVFARSLGFPAFYGRNMNAWIDCLTYIDEDDGMSNVLLGADEILVLRVGNASSFAARCPEQFEALVRCTALVDGRRGGCRPTITLDLSSPSQAVDHAAGSRPSDPPVDTVAGSDDLS